MIPTHNSKFTNTELSQLGWLCSVSRKALKDLRDYRWESLCWALEDGFIYAAISDFESYSLLQSFLEDFPDHWQI